ncbi:Flp family type IVb pilin [Dongia sp. agr-C8]
MSKPLDGAAGPVRNGFGRAETGATAIEYALIAALVSVFIVTSVALTGNGLTSVYNVLNAAMVGVFGN